MTRSHDVVRHGTRILLRGNAAADRFACASEARAFGQLVGLSTRRCEELALAVSELASNVARHAVDGCIELTRRDSVRPLVEVVCRDRGPGIENASAARGDGFSGGRLLPPDAPRTEGLGLGFGAIERLVDELRIESVVGVGTTVIARKWIP